MIGGQVFDFSAEIVVMAIVNRTPDSFFDAGRTYPLEVAVAAALGAVDAGARWVDIGGVPFSPARAAVSVAEEIDRVVPVITAVAAASPVVISVDTVRPDVARASIAAGASVINDTSGLADPALAEVVARSNATVVLAHSRGGPGRIVRRPAYADVVADVRDQLAERVAYARAMGIAEDRIVIDPGHDLHKNTEHSLALTRRLTEIADLGLPVLAAVSNKDFVGEATGLAKADRLAPSLAAATACALNGARIIRMHAAAEARAVARMVETILGIAPPAYLRHNLD